MRLPRLSIRHRVLGAFVLMAAVSVGLMALLGMRLRRVLRTRARESCLRTASLFSGAIRERLLHLVADAKTLADSVADVEGSLSQQTAKAFPTPNGQSLIHSWAVYDAQGRSVARRRCGDGETDLERLGVGSDDVPSRERARLAEAIAGRNAMVLIPDGETAYALHYRGIRREGRPGLALQVATRIDPNLFPRSDDAGGARATFQPFATPAGEPHTVSIDAEPHLLVHRSVTCAGRQLGTVLVAVPYGAEVRAEMAAMFAFLVVVLGSILFLGLISFELTSVAVRPLRHAADSMRNIQQGSAIEHITDLPAGETGQLLGAYQDVVRQSQDWADRLMESSRALRSLLTGTAEALVGAIEAKDKYTAGHSQRVADVACRLARHLGWGDEPLEELRLGAVLHDIGKIGINDAIINKPGKLTEEEMEAVRQHPLIGARIIGAIPGSEELVRVILHHHERHDGSGYPTGMAGPNIPEAARIVAIADVYDALASARSYRPAFPPHQVIAMMAQGRGSLFDPELLDTFVSIIGPDHDSEALPHAPPAAAGAEPLRPPLDEQLIAVAGKEIT